MNHKKIYILTAVLFLTGCNLEGIQYDWASYDRYKPATVVNAPAETAVAVKSAEFLNVPVLQFFAVGCAGSGNEGQRLMASSMSQVAKMEKIDLTLYLGDNFYGRGVDSIKDPKWKSRFEGIYDPETLDMPFYAVLGNHDHYKNPDAQIEYSKTSKRWRMPARHYTFEKTLEDGTQIQFFALDTLDILKGKGALQLQWLDKNLGASAADWKIVYGHHPIYSEALTYRKDIEKLRKILEPLFISHEVNLYLSAHNHSLEILKPVSRVNYIVSGAGSRPRDVPWADQTLFAYADISFSWFRVSKNSLEVLAVGKEGQLLYHGEISK